MSVPNYAELVAEAAYMEHHRFWQHEQLFDNSRADSDPVAYIPPQDMSRPMDLVTDFPILIDRLLPVPESQTPDEALASEVRRIQHGDS